MSAVTHIEWTDATVNWWWGCKEVSEACRYCYARTMDRMRGPLFDNGRVHWGPNAPRWVRTDSATEEARALNRRAGREGKRLKVFVNSMSDTFEEHDQLDAARAILFAEIEKLTNLDFQLLTKRPENIKISVPPHWMFAWPSHVWIGTTVEDQKNADKRIPELLNIPAKVRFLSCEPLLGQLNLTNMYKPNMCEGVHYSALEYGIVIPERVDWVICGGESGSNARPMHPEWAHSLRDQCLSAGVPFFFKQWGEWVPRKQIPLSKLAMLPDRAYANARPIDGDQIYRVGKSAAGRLLDGCEWSEFPNFRPAIRDSQ